MKLLAASCGVSKQNYALVAPPSIPVACYRVLWRRRIKNCLVSLQPQRTYFGSPIFFFTDKKTRLQIQYNPPSITVDFCIPINRSCIILISFIFSNIIRADVLVNKKRYAFSRDISESSTIYGGIFSSPFTPLL